MKYKVISIPDITLQNLNRISPFISTKFIITSQLYPRPPPPPFYQIEVDIAREITNGIKENEFARKLYHSYMRILEEFKYSHDDLIKLKSGMGWFVFLIGF